MKTLFAFLFSFAIIANVNAAARFLVGGGTGNWTSTTNWAATTGGASGQSAPILGDDVTFDAASGATDIILDTSARACTSLVITSGYTGTMTFTNDLSVSGLITLGANMNFAGAGSLLSIGGGTLTSSGKTLPQPFKIGSTSTTTLADVWTVSGTVTTQQLGLNETINGNRIDCTSHLTFGQTTGNISGTTVFRMAGTGTVSQPGEVTTSGGCFCPFEINTAGTCTITGAINFSVNGSGNFKYTAGTVIATGATFWCGVTGGNYTFNINAVGLTLGAIKFAGGTLTFTGTEGFTMSDLEIRSYTTASTITMLVGKTYTITNSLVGTSLPTAPNLFRCITATSNCNLSVGSLATTALAYVNFTDVTATGIPIYTYTGTLLRTANITTGSVIANTASGSFTFGK